ncbi:MAG: DUF1868 domain-containing protein [Prochloraceae cyanobacterium]
MDETYQNYVNRVARLTLPATYNHQLENIQASPKFEGEVAVSFPGYSIITPIWQDDSENSAFYHNLQEFQQQLLEQLDSRLIIPVTPASFHLTLADLIWDSAYREAVRENPEFEGQLQKNIATIFEEYRESVAIGHPSRWQLLGLMIRPRAIMFCLVPKDEQSYNPILQLRRYIYQNSDLMGLGIEQQYNFTAHITFGYFGEITANLDRDRLTKTLSSFNDRWLESEPQILSVERAELRKFDDMLSYYREPDWPILDF